jgi:hypothetical protein
VSERVLRRRCRSLLRQLDVRPPLDVSEVCARLGTLRGRPIHLLAHPLPASGPFGVWLSTPAADYIVYQKHTSRPHQAHIILHELGHLIADHRGDEEDNDVLQLIYPDLDPDVVRRALHRTSYDNAQERDAETVATIILQWASVLDPMAYRLSATQAGQRLQGGLGDRMGWL